MIEEIKKYGDFECPEKVEILFEYLDVEATKENIEEVIEASNNYYFDGEEYQIYSEEEADDYTKSWNDEIFDIIIEKVPDYFKQYINKVEYLNDYWTDFEDIMEDSIFYGGYYIIQQ